MATGHYARVTRDAGGVYHLFRGIDHRKDQAYFLFALTQAQLARALFPVGGMPKDDVRRVALARGLRVADKPDSQEICFVPDGDYAAVVDRHLPADRSGLVVDMEGRVVGRHDGVHHFTIGQRKGLGISAAEPLYRGDARCGAAAGAGGAEGRARPASVHGVRSELGLRDLRRSVRFGPRCRSAAATPPRPPGSCPSRRRAWTSSSTPPRAP